MAEHSMTNHLLVAMRTGEEGRAFYLQAAEKLCDMARRKKR